MKLIDMLKKNDLHIKLMSLLIAIFLWSFIMGIVDPETPKYIRNIEVEFEGASYLSSEGLSIKSPENPRIMVELVGKKSDLNSVNASNISATANLEGLKEGESKVPINISINGVLGRVTVEDIEPSSLVVGLEKIMSENIKINIETLGNLPEGYVLGNIKIDNSFVRVTEPKSRLELIDRAVTYVDINNKTESFLASGEIEFLDKNGLVLEGIETSKKSINIDIPIFKVKSVPININFVGDLKEDQKIENLKLSKENIMLMGSAEQIDKIANVITEPIDYETLYGNSEITSKIQLPEGVGIYNDSNSLTISYNFINNVEKTIDLDMNKLEIRNKNPDLDYRFEDLEENGIIRVYGDSSIVEELNSENTKIYLDVEGLTAGNYRLDINFENENNLNVREIVPEKASIIIEEIEVNE